MEASLSSEQINWLIAIDEVFGLNDNDMPIARLSQVLCALKGQKTEVENFIPPDVYTAAILERRKESGDDQVTQNVKGFLSALKHK